MKNTIKEFITSHQCLLKECLVVFLIILTFSLFSLCSLFYSLPDETKLIADYEVNTRLVIEAAAYGAVMIIGSSLIFYHLHPGGKNKPNVIKTSHGLIYGILMFLGLIAYIVIANILFVYLGTGKGTSYFLATFITLIYVYLMYKLYYEHRVESNKIVWELIRFALVGVIAALFDFTTVTIMRNFVLKSLNNPTTVTILAVTFGFIVGVSVNYLCSIFMVYKSGLKKSKTIKGVVLFVGLSAVGLLIGIGLEALFYDFIKLPYIAVFVIRTIVVLIWNYISRKLFIFKKSGEEKQIEKSK